MLVIISIYGQDTCLGRRIHGGDDEPRIPTLGSDGVAADGILAVALPLVSVSELR